MVTELKLEETIDLLDPDFVKFWKENIRDLPKSHDYDISEYRENPDKFDPWREGLAKLKLTEDPITIKCPVSFPTGEITLLVYNAQSNSGPRPAHINYHGGGGVVGAAGMDDPFLRRLAKESNALVVDVDYRIAPEYGAPIGALDGFQALKFVLQCASEYNIDTSKFSVGGASAGGNIAAVVSQLARDEGIPICLQLLVVPVLDSRILKPTGEINMDIPYDSWIKYSLNPILPVDRMRWFHNHLFGKDDLAKREKLINDPRVSPMCGNLKNVAPALIQVAGVDLLKDEGLAYAKALKEHSVEVDFKEYPSLPHTQVLSPLPLRESMQGKNDAINALCRAYKIDNSSALPN